ncbi:methyl-accepting chemotaxis protein [Celerinatantimonas sp. YJH-8]|uniref:methyl-accepting chemotaxis protein n=1 Tax=Celerinatantimonas sp. YJH-8 TaxID=3228714 RepID=UPI0038BE4DE3
MSIKQKLVLTVVLVLAVLTAIQITTETFNLRQNLQNTLQRHTIQLGHTTANQLNSWLQEKVHILKTISQFPHDDQLKAKLRQAQLTGQLTLTYYASEQGEMLVGDDSYKIPEGYDPRVRPWYQDVRKQPMQGIYYPMPYVDASTHELVMTIGRKVPNGVFAIDLSLDKMVQLINALSNDTTQAFLVDKTGTLLVYPDLKFVLKPISQISPQLNAEHLAQSTQLQDVNIQGKPSLVSFIPVPGTEWYLGLSINRQLAYAEANSRLIQSITLGVISFLIVVLVLYGAIQFAFKPLKKLQQAVDDLGSGNADLTKRIQLEQNDEIGKLAQSFNVFIERIHQMLKAIYGDAEQLNENARQTAQSIDHSQEALTHQQQEVTQVATALHQMSATASDVAANAEQAAHAAHDSTQASEKGREVIRANQQQIKTLAEQLDITAQGVQQLDDDSQEIATILGTIQDIAEQTNLLALNAAIEAARAGEQGRGFAVVADEVRNLSQRTQHSTEEIREMLKKLATNTQSTVQTMRQSREKAQHSVDDAQTAATMLDDITQSILQINDMVTQISSAAEEQRAVTEEISRNTQGISDVSDNLQQQATESTGQARQLDAIAKRLHDQLSQFIL